ncbi:kinase-like domain-containing protein [Glomus cerebriforme]|uniref:Kinase-like domain-containing protein n=1 Tax=Glomus cerebriforme TaxID=658196 RepID=A0A397SYX4_9GLOM|nr:kinase-like domain-containing protein [Glomus cerebriforme]
MVNYSSNIIQCYGITRDPKTNDFKLVMDYANNGDLNHYLKNNNSLDWIKKLEILQNIITGLNDIHNNNLIHCNIHCDDIWLNTNSALITEFSLCRFVNIKPQNNNFAQYTAPRILNRKYTQKDDIYEFGMVAYKVCTGLDQLNPYYMDDTIHTISLTNVNIIKIPQLIANIIKRCLDEAPLNRPTANELKFLFDDLFYKSEKKSLINKQIKEANEINKKKLSSSIHPNELFFQSDDWNFIKKVPNPKHTKYTSNTSKAHLMESEVNFIFQSRKEKSHPKYTSRKFLEENDGDMFDFESHKEKTIILKESDEGIFDFESHKEKTIILEESNEDSN